MILFISRDACSDSIAKLVRACFYGVSHNYRAMCCNWGSAQMDLGELITKEGLSHHSGALLTSRKKYCEIWGSAAIVSQYRAMWSH